jgi:GNAT superfamily N-acetyltransferase
MRFHDKNGQPFGIKPGCEDDIDRLMEMYAQFHPRGHYQGLPPLNLQACLPWIKHLFKKGENFLALRDERIVGHAALLPDFTIRDGEYLVFIHQDHRGQGIGTFLTHWALEQAKYHSLTTLWLTVEPHNFIAIRFYQKCGFHFCGQMDFIGERKMILHLSAGNGS